MSTLTKEWLLKTITELEEDRDAVPGAVNEDAANALAAMKLALASLEAEPVAYIIQDSDARSRGEKGILRYFANISDEDINEYEITVTPLYAAPPETVSVPDAMEMDDDFDSAFEHGKAVGWNAYRAAMLQSGNFRENKNSSTNNFREIAETSTNYPVIPSEVLSAIQKVAKIRADFDDFDGDRRGIGDCLDEAEQELIVTINKYASQLAAEPIAPNDVREQTAIPQVPVTPDGWVIVPKKLTAENGAKGVLSGEFSETTFISCPECFGDDDCETCDCSGRIEIKVPVSWTTIKTIWAKGCEHFSIVAPQQDG
ncbi:TPA: Eaa protein [Escherichia coli]|nr:Eaa protein [Escherichia coli]